MLVKLFFRLRQAKFASPNSHIKSKAKIFYRSSRSALILSASISFICYDLCIKGRYVKIIEHLLVGGGWLFFRGGTDLKELVVLVALLVLIGTGTADTMGNFVPYENPTTIEEKNLTFNMEQSVSGTGFFSTYRYSQMPDATGAEGWLFNGIGAKNTAHGSGIIDTKSLMYAESSYLNRTWVNGAYDEDGNVITDEESATSVVQMNEDSKMSHNPISMAVGSRYYAYHPVVFNSLLGENTLVKNRDGFNSLNHRVDYAHGLDIQLDTGSDIDNTYMHLNEDLVSGRVHVGALQLPGIPRDEVSEDESEPVVLGPAMKAWHTPIFVLDEDYIGTYHIEKNLNLYISEEEEEEEVDWLPCCSGGFMDMDPMDLIERRSARGIFDCTCYTAPKEAQFPRVTR